MLNSVNIVTERRLQSQAWSDVGKKCEGMISFIYKILTAFISRKKI